MSTHASRDPRFHEGERKPAYLPIACAIMITCPLITCFLIDAQGQCPGTQNTSGCSALFSYYAGSPSTSTLPAGLLPFPYLEIVGACIIWAGSLVGYLVFIWRSATRGYSYNAW